MSQPASDQFVDLVRRSGIVDQTKFESWSCQASVPGATTKELALSLVKQELLTSWQAKMLLKGVHQLTLGNYLLSERIETSEFGDRFIAEHRQLSRHVVIQYLPVELSRDPSAKRKIFECGGKLVGMDHPNLAHVLDVDEEKGRIYLVAEQVEGNKLSQIDMAPLGLKSRARILCGCLTGILHAHQHGIVHGSIEKSTVVVDDQKVAKLVGLTKFAIKNSCSSERVDTAVDIRSFHRLAMNLLPVEMTTSQGHRGLVEELHKAIELLRNDPKESLKSFESWIAKHASADGISANVTQPKFESAGSVDEPVPSQDKTRISNINSPPQPATIARRSNYRKQGFLTRLSKRSPFALLSMSTLASAVLICGTLLAASRLTGEQVAGVPDSTTDSVIETDVGAAKKVSSAKPIIQKAGQSNDESVTSNVENTGESTIGQTTNPAAKQATTAAIVKNWGSESDWDRSSKAMVFGDSDSRSPADKSEQTQTIPIAKVTIAAEPATGTETLLKDTGQSVEFLLPDADPFVGFANSVDLPSIDSLEEHSFGNLVLEKQHLLAVELLCTESVHRSKPLFEVQKRENEQQTWDVLFKKKRRSKPVSIAELTRKPTTLMFRWLAAAKDVKTAGYLRNCRMKLVTPNHSHWLSLRKPILIEDFRFSDSGRLDVELEIPFLPNPQAIIANADLIKVKPHNSSRKYGSRMYPSEILPGFPARMFFEEDTDRFLSIEVAAEIRKKLRLQAGLFWQPIPNEPPLILNPNMVEQAMARVRELAAVAAQDSDRAKASELKTEEKKVFSDAAKAMKGRAELTEYYEHIVPQLVDKTIPVTISLAIDEQHEVILVQTMEQESDGK